MAHPRAQAGKEPYATYDLLLTYTADSLLKFTHDREKFLSEYGKVGLGLKDVQQRGKEAAEYFKWNFGVDFTDLDTGSLEHVEETRDGVTFMSFYIIWEGPHSYRMVSAINKTNSAVFAKADIGDLGWMVSFKRDFTSTGNYSGQIPSGAFATFGDYIVHVHEDQRRMQQPFFPENVLDQGNLRIRYRTPGVIYTGTETSHKDIAVLDLDLDHATYGKGSARGILDQKTGDIRNVLRFPNV